MPVRTADAKWEGNLREGSGTMKFGSGAYEGAYSFASRMEEGTGTNPEELLGAAHAGCFSMALSAGLTRAGFTPGNIHTTAKVHFENASGGFSISKIDLQTEAQVSGIDEAAFIEQANAAKRDCPVSRALAGTEITLEARLL